MTEPVEARLQDWLSANWKWALPVAGLLVLLVVVVFTLGIFTIVTGAMKSSWAFREGVTLAGRNSEVVAALGRPIRTGWFVSGTINVSGPSGDADISIPLRGPHGKGTLYVIAEKRAGAWRLELAQVVLQDGNRRIDLLSERDAPPAIRVGPAGERIAGPRLRRTVSARRHAAGSCPAARS